MNLLIIGAPGAGKGTMSDILIKNFDLVHISTGDMLREAVKNGTPVGKIAQGYMNAGALVPDEVIHDIIMERFSKDDLDNGFLFDGYPRTKAQAEDLSLILKQLNKKIDAVINLDISDEDLVKRITGRRLCPACGEIYNIYYKKPSKELPITSHLFLPKKRGSVTSVEQSSSKEKTIIWRALRQDFPNITRILSH